MIYLAPDSAMIMKKSLIEKRIAILMFVLVLVVFSFAERDTKKLVEYYSAGTTAKMPARAPQIASMVADSHQASLSGH